MEISIDWGAIAQWGILLVVVIVQVVQFKKNGTGDVIAQATDLRDLINSVNNIEDAVYDETDGLKGIRKAQESQEKHCITVSSNLNGRIKLLENKDNKS